MQTVALIDYGSGNIRSASRALERAAQIANRRRDIRVTADPDFIVNARKIVLPGVGHFADCADGLRARDGVVEALGEAVQAKGAGFLGICVGMQLLASLGLEDGETPGLDWIPGVVDAIKPDDATLPVPHMGWNTLSLSDHALFDGLGEAPHVYFVHSYAITPKDSADIAATSDYGGEFVAAVGRDNIFGTQFHPEKSQQAGLRLLANFLDWKV
ncbi:MAG: imidazole glycerol phosphate synthase subunit HisH [Pseudomonadota bacterium]